MSDKLEDRATPEQISKEYNEAIDIFPALHKYKKEHNILNLKKLCIEVADFCKAIYASTQSEEEREVYKLILGKLNK